MRGSRAGAAWTEYGWALDLVRARGEGAWGRLAVVGRGVALGWSAGRRPCSQSSTMACSVSTMRARARRMRAWRMASGPRVFAIPASARNSPARAAKAWLRAVGASGGCGMCFMEVFISNLR